MTQTSDVGGAVERPELLTDAEVEFLILATIDGSETGIATEEEMKIVVDWAESVRLDQSLLGLVLTNQICVSVQDGEVCFIDKKKIEENRKARRLSNPQPQGGE